MYKLIQNGTRNIALSEPENSAYGRKSSERSRTRADEGRIEEKASYENHAPNA